MPQDQSLTILTASYNDWASLEALLPMIDDTLAGKVASVRIVVVDDGSQLPCPLDALRAARYRVIDRIDVVTLLRNLGNQRALAIGVGWVAANIESDLLAVMDCDHEDRPEVLAELLDAAVATGGRKIIFAARTQRSEGAVFKALYAVYKRLYQVLTGMPIAIGNFSLIPGRLVRRLGGVWEIGVHFPAGIMKAKLPYASIGSARGKRMFGKSSMNMVNLIVHGLSGLAVHAEVVAVRVVLATFGLSGLVALYTGKVLYEKLFTDLPPVGFTTQVLAVFGGVFFQAIISSLLLLFVVLNVRGQRPMIPIADHHAFILEVDTIDCAKVP